MLTPEQIQHAADHLLHARRTNTPGSVIPDAFRPTDVDSALAIQERVMEQLGETIGGWKCAATDSPVIVAPVFTSALHRLSPVKVANPKGQIEPEIAVETWRDLPPRDTPYTDAELREALVAVHFVVEILATRYADKLSAGPIDLLADNYNNEALFIGQKLPMEIIDGPLEVLPVKISSADAVYCERDGKHPSGHPMKAFSHLVRFLNKRGQGIKRGEIVTTGSYVGIVEVPLNTNVEVKLGSFAPIHLELQPHA
jgi:2-keto-4-pentenoate hydratase